MHPPGQNLTNDGWETLYIDFSSAGYRSGVLSDHGLAVGAGVHDDLAVVHGERDQAAAQPASVAWNAVSTPRNRYSTGLSIWSWTIEC